MEEDGVATMGCCCGVVGGSIVKAWNDFDGYLKRHTEVWQSLANKLWDGFVDYKDVPLGDKEVWHEQKN